MSEGNKDATTVIGGDTVIKGEMSFKSSANIVGTFEGTITGEGQLNVSANAMCKANVDSSSVTVDGRVEGNLVAREKVQLNAKGVVKGDIVAGKMIMNEGASFFGQCSVGPEAVKAAQNGRNPGHAVGDTGHAAPGAPGASRVAGKV